MSLPQCIEGCPQHATRVRHKQKAQIQNSQQNEFKRGGQHESTRLIKRGPASSQQIQHLRGGHGGPGGPGLSRGSRGRGPGGFKRFARMRGGCSPGVQGGSRKRLKTRTPRSCRAETSRILCRRFQ